MRDMPTDGRVRAAGILLLTRQSQPKFLLMRHADRWDLPKGHCDPGESFEQTALRETYEETGIPADKIQLDKRFEFTLQYPVQYKRWGEQTFEKTVKYFLGRIPDAVDPELTEHESAEWIAWKPPHQIQSQTIDPLLAAVADHLQL